MARVRIVLRVGNSDEENQITKGMGQGKNVVILSVAKDLLFAFLSQKSGESRSFAMLRMTILSYSLRTTIFNLVRMTILSQ
jgi:hypothetical protein